MTDITPPTLWRFPAFRIPALWEDEEDLPATSVTPGGISVSEDDKFVYVSAALPGIDPKDIEVTFDKGMLWIKGESKEEEKGKKIYRKAASSFSYRIAVPGELDQNAEPDASCKNGIMTVTFTKIPAAQPKKITVKSGK